jgi:hypothetical protein
VQHRPTEPPGCLEGTGIRLTDNLAEDNELCHPRLLPPLNLLQLTVGLFP